MKRIPPTLDLRLDGSFQPPPRAGIPLSLKVMIGAVLVAAVAISLSLAALAVWAITLLLPVALVAGVVLWGAASVRRWQIRRGGHGQPLTPRR